MLVKKQHERVAHRCWRAVAHRVRAPRASRAHIKEKKSKAFSGARASNERRGGGEDRLSVGGRRALRGRVGIGGALALRRRAPHAHLVPSRRRRRRRRDGRQQQHGLLSRSVRENNQIKRHISVGGAKAASIAWRLLRDSGILRWRRAAKMRALRLCRASGAGVKTRWRTCGVKGAYPAS
jgi:hypothetical protein